MVNPTIKIVNVDTNEEIEREMTDAEFNAWKKGNEAYDAKLADIEQRKSMAESKLAALGLTLDDLKVLGLG